MDVDDASAFDGVIDEVGRWFEERREIEGRFVISGNSVVLNAIVLVWIALSRPIYRAKHVFLCHIYHMRYLKLFELRNVGCDGGISEQETREYFVIRSISIASKRANCPAYSIQFADVDNWTLFRDQRRHLPRQKGIL